MTSNDIYHLLSSVISESTNGTTTINSGTAVKVADQYISFLYFEHITGMIAGVLLLFALLFFCYKAIKTL